MSVATPTVSTLYIRLCIKAERRKAAKAPDRVINWSVCDSAVRPAKKAIAWAKYSLWCIQRWWRSASINLRLHKTAPVWAWTAGSSIKL